MMRTITISITVAMLALIFFGCSVLNPYNSEFKCKKTYKGECMQTQDAYESSLNSGDITASQDFQSKQDDKEGRSKAKNKKDKNCKSCNGNKDSSSCKGCSGNLNIATSTGDFEDMYKQSQYAELTKIIDAPKTPIVRPPEVMRILLLGYTGAKNEFFSHRYMYIYVGDPQWVVSPNDEIK